MLAISTDPNQPGTWRFTLFGFPIAVHWLFWVVAVLLGRALSVDSPYEFQMLCIWVVVLFVSILVHELGHAFAFRRFGGKPRILLWSFGGLAIDNGRYSRRENILITLAGPAYGLVLGGAVFLISRQMFPGESPFDSRLYWAGHLPGMVWMAVFVNVFWSLVNLLPIHPLDGGQLLGHVMRDRNRELRAKIGMGCAIVAGVGLSVMQGGDIFPLLMFGYLAYMNYQMAQPRWR